MNWFENVFGFVESDRGTVHAELEVVGDRRDRLRAKRDGAECICGRLEIVSLQELRSRYKKVADDVEVARKLTGRIRVSEIVADAKALHADRANAGALFQVASQFNLLEMVTPHVTPEQGITIYEHDPTQGPACAVACGAGTVYRNYFVELDDQIGQTASRQVDCLASIGKVLGNSQNQLWQMKNGYALPTAAGLNRIDAQLGLLSEAELTDLRGKLMIGLQWDTQVTLHGCNHLVSQAYCSALPVAYSGLPSQSWERFAKLILAAAYEATFAAAVLNAAQSGIKVLYLTLLGGGAFGNELSWILESIERAVYLYRDFDLDVRIVSFRNSNPVIRDLCNRLTVI